MLEAVRQGAQLLPAAARKPMLLRHWLLGARWAHAAASALLVFAVFLLPVVMDGIARAFPPEGSRGAVSRFFDRVANRPDPRLEARRRLAVALTWTAGLTGVAALLLAALPRAVATASAHARALAERGDSLASGHASESALLHRAALELTLDPAAEAALEAKLTALEDASQASTRPDADLRALRAAETQIAPVQAPGGERAHVGGGRYQVQKELGRGGMGVVYQALDTVLEREVALKELPAHLLAQPELARRFKQEARVLARLSHPNIVQVHDLVEDGERLWIAMELVRGGTLADALARAGGSLPWWHAAALAEQIAAGIDHAHAQGVIHRDIKPINVLLTHEEGGVAKITDFGLARSLSSSVHTQAGTLLGSARYMSPEQAAGRPTDARSDLYAFGVTLYELLAGRPPFEGDVPAVLAQHLSQPPPPLRSLRPAVPERLAALVHVLLAKDPDERPASLGEARALFAALAHEAAAQRTEVRRA